jgi:hypothetical protein
MFTGDNDLETGLNQAWKHDNQAWWDWYVTLADNTKQPDPREFVELPPLPCIDIPSATDIKNELSTKYIITKNQIESFQRNGFIKLPNVLSPGAVANLRREIFILLNKTFDLNLKRSNNSRFLSLEMMWLENTVIRNYVLSSRIAKICSDLLGVDSVRLYHDNALAKEPGCGRTPWHCDDDHFPLATHNVVTAWIPAQAIPLEMGPLAFAKPLDVCDLVKNINFNKLDTSYDKEVSKTFKSNHVSIEDGPFELGEVSFHHNLSYHTAAGNTTKRTRVVLANTFFEDGARVVDNPTMVSGDWQKFIPGVGPGEIAASELNPICWPAKKDGNDQDLDE